MIEVEVVVEGGLGELALSLMPGFVAERRLFTRLTVASQAEAVASLARLERAGLEVTRVVEVS